MTGQLPLTGVGAAVTGYPLESAILGPAGGRSRVPYGPLPVVMVDLRALALVLINTCCVGGSRCSVNQPYPATARCYRTDLQVMIPC